MRGRGRGRRKPEPGGGRAGGGSGWRPDGQPEAAKGGTMVGRGLEEATLRTSGADYLITREHSRYFSGRDDAALAGLAPRLRLLAEFDPAAWNIGATIR